MNHPMNHRNSLLPHAMSTAMNNVEITGITGDHQALSECLDVVGTRSPRSKTVRTAILYE